MANVKRDPHALYFDEPSLTKQEFKEECDINVILERAQRGGDIGHLQSRVPQYGDFSRVPDYRTSLDMVNRAQGLFMALPAVVRDRFANDPGRFLDFLNDPDNADEAVKLGLAEVRKADGSMVRDSVVDPEMGSAEPVKADVSGAKKAKAKPVDD